jgi:protoporphyrinogen oxidase
MSAHPIVIVGAGVAGLTLAHELSARGRPVTVLERSGFVGGLARTWRYGDFRFDVGPHRFHTDNNRVEQFIRDVLGPDAMEIRRSSAVRMFDRLHEWPLRPSVLASMPFSVMLAGARDLMRRREHPGQSFEADVLNRYGRTLYEIFFRPYTTKFLFRDPADLHRDWARAGVNRAVIDSRAAARTLGELLRTTLLPRPVNTTFLYPPGGVGVFSERLAGAIHREGGRVLLDRRVTAIETRSGRVTAVRAGAERFEAGGLVWTGPITEAAACLGLPGIDLPFLSTIFLNVELTAPARLPYQWTYFGGDEIFSRISTPRAFDETMVPGGRDGLCVEVTCREGDARWQRPDTLVEPVVADMIRTGAIGGAGDVSSVHVEPVRNTYPIYTLGYPAELARVLRALGGHPNLLLAGRCGRFWYNNADPSIGQALTMADRILRGDALAGIDEGSRDYWEESGPAAAPAGEPVPAGAHADGPAVAPSKA